MLCGIEIFSTQLTDMMDIAAFYLYVVQISDRQMLKFPKSQTKSKYP